MEFLIQAWENQREKESKECNGEWMNELLEKLVMYGASNLLYIQVLLLVVTNPNYSKLTSNHFQLT